MPGVVGIGIDLVDVDRFRATLARTPSMRVRMFTDDERAYAETASDPAERYAARFAAKEATSKALGTGIVGIRWQEMEVLPNRRGKPVLILHGDAAMRAHALGLTHFSVSLTHSRTDAMAFVVASGPGSAPTTEGDFTRHQVADAPMEKNA